MSVLVEALSLVVRRITLDLSWPGGADAFLQSLCRDDSPCRRLCTDGTLASVSFFTPEQAAVVGEQLMARGLIAVDDDQFVDFAFVDQHYGPTMPCSWLAWQRHRDGFTYAWPVDTEPGDMAVPIDWTPEQSHRLMRTDVRDDSARMLRLAHDEATGLETWLDFTTGALSRGFARDTSASQTAPTATTVTDPSSADVPTSGLLKQVDDAIRDAGYTVAESTDALRVLRFTGTNTDYLLRLWADDASGLLVCTCLLPTRVPAERRGAAAEAVARINYELPVGAFDLDLRDGELRFRSGADLEGTILGPLLVVNMIGIALQSCERFHDALLSVAFGGSDPADAVALTLRPLVTPTPAGPTPDAATEPAADALDIDQIIAELTAEMEADAARKGAQKTSRDVADAARNGNTGRPGTASQPATSTPEVDLEPPLPNSYVVPGTRLVAGEYPGCYPGRRKRAEAKLGALLDAGVRTIVDLTRPEDGLAPYADALDAVAAKRGIDGVVRHALPIRDMGTCDPAQMREILGAIDTALADGRGVYVHCWGGVGRTGTVIGCWLVRHGRTGDEALAEVSHLFATMSPEKLARHPEGSPQTHAQRAMVLGWRAQDEV